VLQGCHNHRNVAEGNRTSSPGWEGPYTKLGSLAGIGTFVVAVATALSGVIGVFLTFVGRLAAPFRTAIGFLLLGTVIGVVVSWRADAISRRRQQSPALILGVFASMAALGGVFLLIAAPVLSGVGWIPGDSVRDQYLQELTNDHSAQQGLVRGGRNTQFDNGLGVPVGSEETYSIPTGYRSFVATLTMDKNLARFQVFMGNRLIYDRIVSAMQDPIVVSCDLGGASTLKIKMDTPPAGGAYDAHGIWGNARFSSAAAPSSNKCVESAPAT
jgi:hypothetical protein